jgi:hypothetical protein
MTAATLTPDLTEDAAPSGPLGDRQRDCHRPDSPAGPDLHRLYFNGLTAVPRFKATRPADNAPTLADIVARYCFGDDEQGDLQ